MRKSIPTFILGLVFSIIGAIAGYVLWLIGVFVGAFSTGAIQTIFLTLPTINLITFVISFIGCFFCLWKARIGGIIMFVASTISIICMTVIFVIINEVTGTYYLFFIPTLAILTNSIIAICIKKKPQLIPQEISQEKNP